MEPGAQFPPGLAPGAPFTTQPYTVIQGFGPRKHDTIQKGKPRLEKAPRFFLKNFGIVVTADLSDVPSPGREPACQLRSTRLPDHLIRPPAVGAQGQLIDRMNGTSPEVQSPEGVLSRLVKTNSKAALGLLGALAACRQAWCLQSGRTTVWEDDVPMAMD